MRIKLTVNQNQTRTPTWAVELTTISYTYLTQWQLLCKNYRPYEGWPKHLSNIGKTKRDQFPVTTSFQTEDVYLFLADVISIPCKIYISSIIIGNAS